MSPRIPVRKIGVQTRSMTGRRVSGNQYESALERDFLALMEWDRGVSCITPQPLHIPVSDPVSKRRSYTPDFLVEWRTIGAIPPRVELVEVKYREAFQGEWRCWRAIGRTAREYAKSQGWRFYFATETSIRTPRLGNIQRLLPYRHRKAEPASVALLYDRLERIGTATVAELVASLDGEPGKANADLLHGLWVELAHGRLIFDEDIPLTGRTVIRKVVSS